jgi:hypothetical protein
MHCTWTLLDVYWTELLGWKVGERSERAFCSASSMWLRSLDHPRPPHMHSLSVTPRSTVVSSSISVHTFSHRHRQTNALSLPLWQTHTDVSCLLCLQHLSHHPSILHYPVHIHFASGSICFFWGLAPLCDSSKPDSYLTLWWQTRQHCFDCVCVSFPDLPPLRRRIRVER